jgi:hypothetical protein
MGDTAAPLIGAQLDEELEVWRNGINMAQHFPAVGIHADGMPSPWQGDIVSNTTGLVYPLSHF